MRHEPEARASGSRAFAAPLRFETFRPVREPTTRPARGLPGRGYDLARLCIRPAARLAARLAQPTAYELSRLGGVPNLRAYSRLNWLGLS